MKRNGWAWALLGIGLSGVFLWLALRDASLAGIRDSLGDADLRLMGLAALLNFVVLAIKSLRWKLLLSVQNGPYPYGGAYATTLLQATGNNLLPARAGEILRVAALSRFGPVGAAHGLGANVIDRTFDFISLVLLTLALIPFPGFPNELWWTTILGALVALAAFLALRWYALRRLHGTEPRCVARLGAHARQAVAHFLDRLALLGNPRLEATTLLLSILSWVAQIGLLLLVLGAYAFQISLLEATLCLIVINIVIALPSAPGSAGTFEFGAVAALEVFGGADATTAATLAVAYHLVQWLPVTLVGSLVAAYTFARRPPSSPSARPLIAADPPRETT